VALQVVDVVSVSLFALVGGLYWGPWLALTRSMATFEPAAFLAIVARMSTNMAPLMTVLMPVALLSAVPVLVLSWGQPLTFATTAVALALFIGTLIVTMAVEVPIVKRIDQWTVATLPADWRQQRDRWCTFHVLRVGPSMLACVLMVVGAIFTVH
jgi:uncharacterized membrane protein